MSKKIFFTITCLLTTLSFFTGCSKEEKTKTIVNSEVAITEEPQKGGNGIVNDPNKQLDLRKCADNVKQILLGDDYPPMDISIELPTEENNFFNVILISEERPETEEHFLWWINDCIVMLNEEAVKQMPDKYAPAGENYYGGLFDEYDIMVTATCNEDIMSKWPVDQMISAGSHDPLVLNESEFSIDDFNDIEL